MANVTILRALVALKRPDGSLDKTLKERLEKHIAEGSTVLRWEGSKTVVESKGTCQIMSSTERQICLVVNGEGVIITPRFGGSAYVHCKDEWVQSTMCSMLQMPDSGINIDGVYEFGTAY